MIKWETIISTADEKITLLQWLKMVEKAINDGALTGISVQQADAEHATITFSFAGDPEQSFTLTLPQGEQGKPGPPGPEGKEGKNGLDVLSIISETIIPYRVKEEPTSLTNIPLAAFSRTPVVGDNFLMTFDGFGAALGRSWVGVCTVSYVGAAVNATVFAVETTGQQGAPGQDGAGLVKRYMHTITYFVEGMLLAKFAIFSDNASPYSGLNKLMVFFGENHYTTEDVSYPATGVYENEGTVYNVWGIYYNVGAGSFYAQYGNNKTGQELGIPDSGVTDEVIDLGS